MQPARLPLAALVLASASASALCAQDNSAVQLVWQSISPDQSALPQEFANLYVSLYNSGNLAVRTVPLGERYIEPAVRDAGVLHGSGFPVALDALLCDLNKDVCDRDRRPVEAVALENATDHIGGFAPSPGRWRAGPRTELVIPDYQFATNTALGRVAVGRSWTPGDFAATDDVDCSTWKMGCDALVVQFNPPFAGTKIGPESATVPYVRYQTPIAVDIGTTPETGSELTRLLGTTEPVPAQQPYSPDPVIISDGFRSLDMGKATPNQLLESVRDNILPIGRIKSYDSHAQDTLAPDVMVQLRAIHHPFGFGRPLPDLYDESVTIGIIDRSITARHCDWPEVRLASGDDLPEEQGECGAVANDIPDSRDHPMLIGGIIVTKRGANGVVGINPHADLVFMPLEFDGPAREMQSLIRTLQSRETFVTEIINLSNGVDRNEVIGSTEILKAAIDGLQGTTLVVTTAGNENTDLSSNCKILPACMNDLQNVITVVGLNRNESKPKIWRSQLGGSNTHPDFDIGAVAEGVYSTVSRNRYGRDSGTSFAAPQVSAAASLVLATSKQVYSAELRGRRILPKFVKDRLIYTADIEPALSGRMRSGRLNVARAIDVAHDQYVLFENSLPNGQTIVTGTTISRPYWIACETPDESEKAQRFWDIRRMTYLDGTGRYFLFKHVPDGKNVGDRNASLKPFESCALKTRSPEVEVVTGPGGESVKFRFSQIRDYTSRFIEEF